MSVLRTNTGRIPIKSKYSHSIYWATVVMVLAADE